MVPGTIMWALIQLWAGVLVITGLLTIKEIVGLLEREHQVSDFSKISLGLAFYGRSHGDVSSL